MKKSTNKFVKNKKFYIIRKMNQFILTDLVPCRIWYFFCDRHWKIKKTILKIISPKWTIYAENWICALAGQINTVKPSDRSQIFHIKFTTKLLSQLNYHVSPDTTFKNVIPTSIIWLSESLLELNTNLSFEDGKRGWVVIITVPSKKYFFPARSLFWRTWYFRS